MGITVFHYFNNTVRLGLLLFPLWEDCTWEKWGVKRSGYLLQWWREGIISIYWVAEPTLNHFSLLFVVSLSVYYFPGVGIFWGHTRVLELLKSTWNFLIPRVEVKSLRRAAHRSSVQAQFWTQNPPQNNVPCQQLAIRNEAYWDEVKPFLAYKMMFKHPVQQNHIKIIFQLLA